MIASRRPRPASRRLGFEPLEDRHMLAIMVINLDDDGPGSLRAAILAANDSPGAEEIEIDAALVGTIRLTSGELEITDTLTINGSGANRLRSIDSVRATLDVVCGVPSMLRPSLHHQKILGFASTAASVLSFHELEFHKDDDSFWSVIDDVK